MVRAVTPPGHLCGGHLHHPGGTENGTGVVKLHHGNGISPAWDEAWINSRPMSTHAHITRETKENGCLIFINNPGDPRKTQRKRTTIRKSTSLLSPKRTEGSTRKTMAFRCFQLTESTYRIDICSYISM